MMKAIRDSSPNLRARLMKVLRGPSASEHRRTPVPAPARVSALSHMGFSHHRRSVLMPLFRTLHGLLGYSAHRPCFDLSVCLSVYHLIHQQSASPAVSISSSQHLQQSASPQSAVRVSAVSVSTASIPDSVLHCRPVLKGQIIGPKGCRSNYILQPPDPLER